MRKFLLGFVAATGGFSGSVRDVAHPDNRRATRFRR
jgi:hypothetical protein